jgi:hypothetical protein
MPNATKDLMRQRERTDAFCEAIRALDATGLPFKNYISLACLNSFGLFLWCSCQGLIDSINALDMTMNVQCSVVIRLKNNYSWKYVIYACI